MSIVFIIFATMVNYEEKEIKDDFVTLLDDDGLVSIQMKIINVCRIINLFDPFVKTKDKFQKGITVDITIEEFDKELNMTFSLNFGEDDIISLTAKNLDSGNHYNDFEIEGIDNVAWNFIKDFVNSKPIDSEKIEELKKKLLASNTTEEGKKMMFDMIKSGEMSFEEMLQLDIKFNWNDQNREEKRLERLRNFLTPAMNLPIMLLEEKFWEKDGDVKEFVIGCAKQAKISNVKVKKCLSEHITLDELKKLG